VLAMMWCCRPAVTSASAFISLRTATEGSVRDEPTMVSDAVRPDVSGAACPCHISLFRSTTAQLKQVEAVSKWLRGAHGVGLCAHETALDWLEHTHRAPICK
jgi:hypothetical protein